MCRSNTGPVDLVHSVHRLPGQVIQDSPGYIPDIGCAFAKIVILYLGQQYGRGIGRIRSYVSDLETVLIQTLATFDINARLLEGFRGVWLEQSGELRKIAAIGVYVNRLGISSHGFALNVHTDLSYFDGIVPCGINDHGVTSISAVLDRDITIEEVIPRIKESFAEIFGFTIQLEGIPYVHR